MLQKVEIFLLGYIPHICNSGRNSLSCVKAAEVNVAGIRNSFSWIVSVSQLLSQLSLLRQCESCRNQKDLYMDCICFATLVSTLFVVSTLQCCRNQKEKIAEAVKQAPKRVVRQVRI